MYIYIYIYIYINIYVFIDRMSKNRKEFFSSSSYVKFELGSL